MEDEPIDLHRCVYVNMIRIILTHIYTIDPIFSASWAGPPRPAAPPCAA